MIALPFSLVASAADSAQWRLVFTATGVTFWTWAIATVRTNLRRGAWMGCLASLASLAFVVVFCWVRGTL